MYSPREHISTGGYFDDTTPILQDSPLIRAAIYTPVPEPQPEIISASPSPVGHKPDLDIFGLVAPPPLRSLLSEDPQEEVATSHCVMSQPRTAASGEAIIPAIDEMSPPHQHNQSRPSIQPFIPMSEVNEHLKRTAALAIEETEGSPSSMKSPPKVDSGRVSQESVPQIENDKVQSKSGSPLQLKTTETIPPPVDGPPPQNEDSITNSPLLRKNMMQIDPCTADTLPAVQQPTSPIHEDGDTTSRKGSVPGYQTLLANLAEIAAQRGAQPPNPASQPPTGRAHSQSFSSTAASPSPMLPYHRPSYSSSAQTSPVSYHGFTTNARSPTSATSESPYHYGSPHPYQPPQAYFSARRSSAATDNGRTFPPQVPSLPSASSGESHCTTGSSTDGYSTSHTTPIDGPGPTDDLQRRILPPPLPGMSVIPAGGFRCDYPNCNAMPFQTQYLLSSHRNVHSQNRPHYCPVQDCSRNASGKGFKRKNEMIRHGLVHDSPGYVCPFCPDREHRYPRPDNLQRHVKVNHKDKDRDDPVLREVLARRCQGVALKQRRRRTTIGGGSAGGGEEG